MTSLRHLDNHTELSFGFNLSRSPSLPKTDVSPRRIGTPATGLHASSVPSDTIILVPKSARQQTLRMFLSKDHSLREEISPRDSSLKISKQALSDVIKRHDPPKMVHRIVDNTQREYQKNLFKRKKGTMFVNDLWSGRFESTVKRRANIQEELKRFEAQRRKPLQMKFDEVADHYEQRFASNAIKFSELKPKQTLPILTEINQFCETDSSNSSQENISAEAKTHLGGGLEASVQLNKPIPSLTLLKTKNIILNSRLDSALSPISTLSTNRRTPRVKLPFNSPRGKIKEEVRTESDLGSAILPKNTIPKSLATTMNFLSERTSRVTSPNDMMERQKLRTKKEMEPLKDYLKARRETLEVIMGRCDEAANSGLMHSTKTLRGKALNCALEKRKKAEEKRKEESLVKFRAVTSNRSVKVN